MTADMTWIDEMRLTLWDAGREERGREPDEPFMGDPMAELLQEYLDALNYIEEGAMQAGHGCDRAKWPATFVSAWDMTVDLCIWTRRHIAE